MSCYQYRKSHCGDKTILRLSYLHNGISYTSKMISLYWIGAQSPYCWLFAWDIHWYWWIPLTKVKIMLSFDVFFDFLAWTNCWNTGDAHVDGFVQERRNSSALAMELRLSCTNPSMWQERRNSSALAMELRLYCTNPSMWQERRNSSALAMELRISCTNPSMWQERRNSSALAMELCLSCTNPSMWQSLLWGYGMPCTAPWGGILEQSVPWL